MKIEPAIALGTGALEQVLLIDGSSTKALSLSDGARGDLLEHFQVTRKTGLEAGLAVLQNGVFQIVLLDLCTSSSIGLESVVRTVAAARDVPVIVLVGEGEMTTASEAIRLGARDYAVRGCRCNSLPHIVRHAIEIQQSHAQINAEIRETTEKNDLSSKLSHDLRNSLACIHQFGNILIDGLAGTLSGEQREYVGIMVQNASKIRSAVESFTNPPPTISVEHSRPTHF